MSISLYYSINIVYKYIYMNYFLEDYLIMCIHLFYNHEYINPLYKTNVKIQDIILNK